MTHTEEVVCPVTTMKEIYAGLHAYFQRWVEDESADYKPKVTMQFETRLIGIAPNDVQGAFWELSQQGIFYAAQFIAEQQANHRWKGFYCTLNPAPLTDVIKGKLSKQLTKDKDVNFCYWILVDIDPVRTDAACTTWNTTEEETENAVGVAEWCKNLLSSGLPNLQLSIENRTGNGCCLMYPVERITAQEHKQILSWIANQYAASIGAAAPTVTFDTKVCNPSRVWRIPGTLGRKPGDDVTRPKVKKCITTTCVKLRADEYATVAINNMGGAYRITGNVEDLGVKPKPFKPTGKAKDQRTVDMKPYPPSSRDIPKPEAPGQLKTITELPNSEWFSRAITYVSKMGESDKNPDYFQRAKWYVETLSAQAPAISGNNGHDRTYAAVIKIVQVFDMLQPQQHWELIKQYNDTGTGGEQWTETELLHKYSDALKAPHNQHVSASVTDATTEAKHKRLLKAVKKISNIFDMLDIDEQIYLVCLYSRVAFRDVCNDEAHQLLADANSKPRLHESMATRPPAPSLRFKFTIENLGGQR